MPRKWFLALLALLFVTPAIAEVLKVQRIEPAVPVKVIPQAQDPSDFADKIMTIEEAREQIAKLRRERRELNTKLAEAAATIEQMTKKGGSLVRAYCESTSVSRNTAGATESCGVYRCGEVDGFCKKSCTISDDCIGGYNCESGQCVSGNKYAEPS